MILNDRGWNACHTTNSRQRETTRRVHCAVALAAAALPRADADDCEPSGRAQRAARGTHVSCACVMAVLSDSILETRMRSLSSLLALCCAALLGCVVSVRASADPRLVVEYSEGRVQGVADGVTQAEPGLQPVRVFRGLPFAQSPVGANRFRAPQARTTNLTSDGSTYDATSFKPPCVQPSSAGQLIGSSEDCLYVNVYTPITATPQSRLPVYVYIHGGGFVGGSAIAFSATNFVVAGFDPAGNNTDAQIIVVTVAYRLGVFGFLALPELSLETGAGNIAASGNWGVMDQRAALQWVQRNIAAFGGDPSRVTLGGESAGAISTCIHLLSPLSAGLFDQALMQSGGCDDAIPLLSDAESIGVRFMSYLASEVGMPECANSTAHLSCLRNMDLTAEYFIAASSASSAYLYFGPYANTPILDGVQLPDYPSRLQASGRLNPVNLLAGTNANEMAIFMYPISHSGQFPHPSSAAIANYSRALSKGNQTIEAFYTSSANWGSQRGIYNDATFAAFESLLSKKTFQCPSRRLARAYRNLQQHSSDPVVHAQTTRMYQFNYTSSLQPGLLYAQGAAHATELPFVFGFAAELTHPSNYSMEPVTNLLFEEADDQYTADALRSYWVRFIARLPLGGSLARDLPGIRTEGLNASWPLLGATQGPSEQTFQFGFVASQDDARDGFRPIEGVYAQECDLWDGATPVPSQAFVPRFNPTPGCQPGQVCAGAETAKAGSVFAVLAVLFAAFVRAD